MRTNSRSRGRGLVLAVLTLVVGLPEVARAQQSGLFPLAPIHRQRIPCDQEDPIYKTYKHQYYGYHPQCWRTFPKGWGCPSPEAPDKEKSFRETPLVTGEPSEGPLPPETEEPMPGQPGGTRPTLPPLPGGARSPFDEPTDLEKPGTPPGAPPGRPTPRPTPPGDPFELDKPDNPATPRRPAAPGAASNGPELSAPAEEAGPIQGARSTRNELFPVPEAEEEEGPMLALPNVNLPPVDDPGVPFGTRPPAPSASAASNATAAAGSGAPRRGFLSGLFNNLGISWTRR
jgi:hypothetical protein